MGSLDAATSYVPRRPTPCRALRLRAVILPSAIENDARKHGYDPVVGWQRAMRTAVMSPQFIQAGCAGFPHAAAALPVATARKQTKAKTAAFTADSSTRSTF